jgi:hypothetical protein
MHLPYRTLIRSKKIVREYKRSIWICCIASWCRTGGTGRTHWWFPVSESIRSSAATGTSNRRPIRMCGISPRFAASYEDPREIRRIAAASFNVTTRRSGGVFSGLLSIDSSAQNRTRHQHHDGLTTRCSCTTYVGQNNPVNGLKTI